MYVKFYFENWIAIYKIISNKNNHFDFMYQSRMRKYEPNSENSYKIPDRIKIIKNSNTTSTNAKYNINYYKWFIIFNTSYL